MIAKAIVIEKVIENNVLIIKHYKLFETLKKAQNFYKDKLRFNPNKIYTLLKLKKSQYVDIETKLTIFDCKNLLAKPKQKSLL